MKTSSIFNCALALFMAFVLLGCNGSPKLVEVDNPSDEAITILFDGEKEFIIEPKSVSEVMLKTGTHTLSINGKDTTLKLLSYPKYMLNPTNADYIIEEILYQGEAVPKALLKYRNYSLPIDTIMLFGIEIPGHFKEIKGDLLITKNWHYGVEQDSPDNIKLSSSTISTTKLKIHRKTDLLMKLIEEASKAN